jgi:hypothetical protein
MLMSGAVVACSLSVPASAKKPEPYTYGPLPEWGHYKALAEAAIRGSLVDPDSARFEWPRGYHQGGYQPLLARKVMGYVTCGYVNARNRMGGYSGRTAFVVVIDYDSVAYADLGTDSGSDMVSRNCQQSAQNLMFPAVSTMPTTPVELPKEGAPGMRSGVGLEIVPLAQGAYVRAVDAGSDAARAGLKPGMIIAQVNGVGLGSLGDAMLRVIEASTSPAQLMVIGQGTYELIRTGPAKTGAQP